MVKYLMNRDLLDRERRYVSVLSNIFMADVVSLEQAANVLSTINDDTFKSNTLIHIRNKIYNIYRHGESFSIHKLNKDELWELGRLIEMTLSIKDISNMNKVANMYTDIIADYIYYCLESNQSVYIHKFIIKPLLNNGIDNVIYEFIIDGIFYTVTNDKDYNYKYDKMVEGIVHELEKDGSETIYKDCIIPGYFSPNGFVIGAEHDSLDRLFKQITNDKIEPMGPIARLINDDSDAESTIEGIRSISSMFGMDYNLCYNLSSNAPDNWNLVANLTVMALHMITDWLISLNMNPALGGAISHAFYNQAYKAKYLPEYVFGILEQIMIPVKFLGVENDLYMYEHVELSDDKSKTDSFRREFFDRLTADIRDVLFKGRGLNQIGHSDSN